MYSSCFASPVGRLLLVSDGNNLNGLWIDKQKYYAPLPPAKLTKHDDLPVFIQTRNWLNKYFRGEKPEISALPLAPRGSEFRQQVWRILRQIPYGQTTTYGEIAQIIASRTGKKMSAQAVGGAVGHNPISIIIPCHRVVGSSGSLTGYAGGLDIKIKLLTMEGVDMTHLFRPRKGTAL